MFWCRMLWCFIRFAASQVYKLSEFEGLLYHSAPSDMSDSNTLEVLGVMVLKNILLDIFWAFAEGLLLLKLNVGSFL